jgi:hypothetical protein
MSDNADEEFTEEKYDSSAVMTSSVATGLENDANAEFLTWIKCNDGDCTNTENPAEEAWVKLMSAIPVKDQLTADMVCVATGFPTPSPGEVQALIQKIRPKDNPDQYAIASIRDAWSTFRADFSSNPNTGVAGNLRTALGELANGWEGDDFDAFAEQVEVVIGNCEKIADDIGDDSSGAVQVLTQKSEEINALQGISTASVPYPAPLYWIKDKGGLFSNPNIHVRVPFAKDGCEVTEGCMFGDGADAGALELGGFDNEVIGEAQQFVASQTEYYLAQGANEEPPVTRAQAERWAAADADRELGNVAEVNSDNFEERAEIANQTVVSRWEDAETSAREFQPAANPTNPSTFGDHAGDLSDADYSPPSGGSGGLSPGEFPTGSGPSGLTPPDSLQPSNPTMPSNPSGFDPTTPSFPDDGGLDDNPWESSVPDPDDVSGGLASGGGLGGGGGGGLGGGGMPGGGAGGGLGGGAGGGLGGGMPGGMGGMMGGAGGGRGAGAGAGGGRGSGGAKGMGKGMGAGAGRGAMGGMMGGAGGGRGMGGQGEGEQETGTWLTEEDDVWGIGNEEEDPYA